MIIDTHSHLGFDEIFDEDFTEKELLESQKKNGIDINLVQPAVVHDFETVKKYHDAIYDLCNRFKDRFKGIANPNPHLPDNLYEKEIKRCILELGFIGIKIHPFGHAVNVNGRHGSFAFKLASYLRVPVLVHTGVGIPWSEPSLLNKKIEEHQDIPVIICHAGGIFAAEAEDLVRRYSNVFLELSWQSNFIIKKWTETIGAHRLMFGSDHADNAVIEITKIKSLGLKPEDEDLILYKTAKKVFNI